MGPKKNADISEQLAEFKKIVIDRLDKLDSKISELNDNLLDVKKVAFAADEKADEALYKSNINSGLIKENSLLLSERVKTLEDQLEDQVNRNMRNTLVFKELRATNLSGARPLISWPKLSKILNRILI